MLTFSIAKKEGIPLLNRLTAYKKNHLLFARRKDEDFTNKLSERDLRKCKNRQKLSGGFRTPQGKTEFCAAKSVIESIRRTGQSVLDAIRKILSEPVMN